MTSNMAAILTESGMNWMRTIVSYVIWCGWIVMVSTVAVLNCYCVRTMYEDKYNINAKNDAVYRNLVDEKNDIWNKQTSHENQIV